MGKYIEIELKFSRSKINWMKDHILLVKNSKHEFNKKGMLRIRDATFSDSGVYSCIGNFNSFLKNNLNILLNNHFLKKLEKVLPILL